jgi:hypothetical protein
MIYKLAKDVRIGDFLFNDELLPEQVLTIVQEVKVGYYAPMSGAGESINSFIHVISNSHIKFFDLGTLIVNGLLASCYANVLSHQLAHWMMAPLRWNYLLHEALGVKQHLHQEIGIHPFAIWMINLAERFIPKQISLMVT